MDQKLRIATLLPPKPTAQQYYRQSLPLGAISALGGAETEAVTVMDQQGNLKMETADIVLFWQFIADHTLRMLNITQQGPHRPPEEIAGILAQAKSPWPWKGPAPDGPTAPPSIVIDIDDNLFDVEPSNPAFAQFGVRLGKRALVPGETIMGKDADGNLHQAWVDGKNGFDIARNRNTINVWREMLRAAELVTVTTERLKQRMLKEAPDANIFVFPNTANKYDYLPWIDAHYFPHGKVRILLQGGSTHLHHVDNYRGSIQKLVKKYPNSEWYFFGGTNPSWIYSLPNNQAKFIDWVEYPAYKATLSAIQHDINVCFLPDNPFNQCRSAIKFYEGSIIKKPAATIAERTGPFLDEIQDGTTGMLFDGPEEFEVKMSKLIEEEELRRNIAANAQQWVLANREFKFWTERLLEEYKRTREKRFKNEIPKSTDVLPSSGPSPVESGADVG
jgi:hypothetical protein